MRNEIRVMYYEWTGLKIGRQARRTADPLQVTKSDILDKAILKGQTKEHEPHRGA